MNGLSMGIQLLVGIRAEALAELDHSATLSADERLAMSKFWAVESALDCACALALAAGEGQPS